jgi:hemerythrin-like domain-containing protein
LNVGLQLIEELVEEHRLVDSVAGALFRCAEGAAAGAGAPEDVADFVQFFRIFVTGYHHQREEAFLFRALAEHAEVPADRGPLLAIAADHEAAAALVDELEAAAVSGKETSGVARSLARHLWEHVDKENSVLLPESEHRLLRHGVNRLRGRPPNAEEETARALGERLCERFPPMEDPKMVRGDGCVACSAFTETCHGIEMEWWNRWDREHHRSLDEG